jgi:branched-chain amino acid transport system permease protein
VRAGWILFGGAVAAALLPWSPYHSSLVTMALLFALLAASWHLLALGGRLSFGHAAFFGVGAYASALLASRSGLDVWAAVPGGGLAAAAVALPVGALSLHLKGPYFSLATFAAAEILRILTTQWTSLTGGTWGLIGLPPLPAKGSLLAAGGIGAVLLVHVFLGRSRWGLALAALRQQQERAEGLGVPSRPLLFAALATSAAFAGLAGALYAHHVRSLEPATAFSLLFSVLPLVMTLFGGMASPAGPLLGAGILYFLDELLLQPRFPMGHQLLYAAAILLVLLGAPEGLAGLARRRGGERGAP